MEFSARNFGRAWLSVALAAGTDKERPQLDRTVYIEQFPTGVRLVATDSYVLLRSWIPNVYEPETSPEPEIDEAPMATAIAKDPHGRAKGFLAHLVKLAGTIDDEDAEDIEIRLTLGVSAEEDDGPSPTLEGMEALYVVLDYPDNERLRLPIHEGVYPNWRPLLNGFKAKSTRSVALNPEIIGRLAKLGKFNYNQPIAWHFGGSDKVAALEVLQSDPRVEGLVMPYRWEFEDEEPPVEAAS